MTIEVKCPNRSCDQQLALGPEMAGKKGKCPKCGKTFQIPQSLGAGRTTATQPTAETRPARQQPENSRPSRQPVDDEAADLSAYIVDEQEDLFAEEVEPAPRRRRRSASQDVVEDYETVPVSAEEDFEEPRPRRSRRRRRRDDYEEDDGYADAGYADDDDDIPRYSKGKSGLSITRRWTLGSIGFLILAIASCVLAASHGFLILSEAFFQLAGAAGSAKLFKATTAFLKISQIVWLLAVIGMTTGYVFCLFIPNKRASLGLTIAALSFSVLNLILGIIFRFVPGVKSNWLMAILSGDFTSSRATHAGWWGGVMDAGDEVLSMFLEFGIVAELMLLSLLMAAIARVQKDLYHKNDCMRVVWFLTGLAGTIFVMYFFMFFIDGGSDKWMGYIVRIINWVCNGLLAVSFMFLIMNLFHTRKAPSR